MREKGLNYHLFIEYLLYFRDVLCIMINHKGVQVLLRAPGELPSHVGHEI